jgi:sugar lactone lactonase YvrE
MRRALTTFALGLVIACTSQALPEKVAATPPAATGPSAAFVAHFDQAAGELPEGLALGADAAFVGFAPSSRVARVELDTGKASAFGEVPAPRPGKGFMTGLAVADHGDLYVGLASFVPEVQAGIYRIDKAGGMGVLFAQDAALPFPNALAFDNEGSLFVSDSGTGSVFRIDRAGVAQRWATDQLLTGKKFDCGAGLGPGFDIGANGLVVEAEAVYVVNTDKATVLKIPREANGNAGAVSVFAGPDCEQLGGADGLARSPDGSFVVAINRQDKLARVSANGRVSTLLSGAPLDFPASLAYRADDLYVTNFALSNASSGKPASPGLLTLKN